MTEVNAQWRLELFQEETGNACEQCPVCVQAFLKWGVTRNDTWSDQKGRSTLKA